MKSMTGYGTAEGKVGKGRLFIEVKTVNHRFCEINVKQPPKMGVLESLIKKYLESKYIRGKVDVFVKELKPLFGDVSLVVDLDLAKKYQQGLSVLIKKLKLKSKDEFLHYVGLDHFVAIREKEGNYDRFWGQIRALLNRSCGHVDKMREKEGLHIRKDQQKRVSALKKLVKQIESESDRAYEKNVERLRKKISDSGQVDEQRLASEVSLLGCRQDIAEEITRLESHIDQYGQLVMESGAVGRKLDFLLQEMNREVNTIGSKAADARISRLVVECKSELERLREQVQNVE